MPPPKAPKTVLDKVIAAIDALADPAGASRQAIKKFCDKAYGEVKATAFKKALAQGVAKGKLEARGTQRFALPGVVLKPKEGESVGVETLREGREGGALAERGDEVDMSYVGTLASDGSQFDAAKSFKFTLGAGEVIKGWDQGVAGMREGERRRLTVPPKLGYGKRGSPPEIPGDATLVFVVELRRIC